MVTWEQHNMPLAQLTVYHHIYYNGKCKHLFIQQPQSSFRLHSESCFWPPDQCGFNTTQLLRKQSVFQLPHPTLLFVRCIASVQRFYRSLLAEQLRGAEGKWRVEQSVSVGSLLGTNHFHVPRHHFFPLLLPLPRRVCFPLCSFVSEQDYAKN